MSRNTQEARASGYQSSKSTNTSGKTLATIQSGVETDGAETKRVGPRRGSSRWSTSGTGSSGSKMTDSANSSSRFSKLARSTRSLLRLTSSKGDAFFKSSSDATPAWLAARRLSTRSVSHAADHRSDDDITLYGTKREEVEELDKAETAATARPLPKGVLNDGFVIPSFDVTKLQDLGNQPAGRGCEAAWKSKFGRPTPSTRRRPRNSISSMAWRFYAIDASLSTQVPGLYLAVHGAGRYGGKPVALKVLREDQNMTEEDRHSFVREAHLLARMTSPYVLKALGGSETVDKLPCILLEWCDTDATRALRLKDVGSSSAARKEVMSTWPSMERLRLMRELASALEFLHSGDAIAGRVAIVHRDLKPDNIGINGAGRVKLLDFGLAVAIQKDNDDDRYELTGGTGSRRYMAPEVCREEPYGVKVDVFSWAIASWEIWTLKGKPYAGLDIDQHMYHAVQQNERPAVPKTWRPELVELLATAWDPSQEGRCTAGYAAGVLSRVETMYAQADPLAPAEAPGCACVVS